MRQLTLYPESLHETFNDSYLLFPSQSPKALEVHWIISTDKLYISVPEFKPREITTKRTIASDLGHHLVQVSGFSLGVD